mgnify:FL=1
MADFGWAYVNCDDEFFEGPTGSVLFITGAQAASGSNKFMYYTASVAGNPPSTLVLSGNMVVTGTLSASVINYEDIAVIDATGSTFFGNTIDDTHMRSGSLVVSGASQYVLSASATTQQVWVRGFGVNFRQITSSHDTASTTDYVMGITKTGNVTLTIPSASTTGTGSIFVVKDQVATRGAYAVTLTCSAGASYTFDNEATLVLTGTMPAVSLYSNGAHWFVF